MSYKNTLKPYKISTLSRVQLLRVILILAGAILVCRLFYVQIIRHDHYQAQALAEHIKKFDITAPRGIINLEDGKSAVPVVLNESRYTIYADPKYIKNLDDTADKLSSLIGVDIATLKSELNTKNSRYVILAKKLSQAQADKIDALQLSGIGKQEVNGRTYPQGNLAAQVLGFVNDDGQGQYGVEGYLNSALAGKTGLEKAVTDVRGIPLAVNNNNILQQPKAGKDLTLTIDIGMQRTIQDLLKSDIESSKAVRGTAVLMEANTGAIKAMANYPTFDPTNYDKISDQSVFMNTAVSMPWEPGSVMKPLIMSAAFTEGTANPDTSYFDPGFVTIDGSTITNSTSWPAETMSLRDVIDKSLNTGAVFVLKTLGGGTINSRARNIWYNYLTQHYFMGKLTGIQQSGEATGYVSDPNSGDGANVRYANMAFGQGITMTPLQLISAYASILNGGTYYKPSLLASQDSNGNTNFTPTIVAKNVISSNASTEIRGMLKDSLAINNPAALHAGYDLGAKSGTAQIPDGKGGYRTDAYDGTYIGYISGGDGLQYVMVVRLDEPKTAGFASAEAAKVWAKMSNSLIDNFAIKPKSS